MSSYFLYVRKSSEETDRQIASIPAQITELRALAERSSITIARVFEETMSAREPGRPVFAEMMSVVRRQGVKGIICWKPDRLARNAIDGGHIIDAFDRHKLAEIVCPGRTFHATSEDKFMLGLEFSLSKKYVDDLSDNVRRGNRAVVAQGRTPGPVPVGYIKQAPRDRLHGRGAGQALPDPERFPLVRSLFEKFLSGTFTVPMLTREATRLGLTMRTPDGSGGRRPGMTTLYAMLRNPFYMGLIRRGHEVFPGEHTPLVSADEFERIQALLSSRSQPRPSRHEFSFRGIIACGACGQAFTGELQRGQTGRGSYVYYRCARRRSDRGICRQPPLKEAQIPSALRAELARLSVPSSIVQFLVEESGRIAARAIADRTHERIAIEQQIRRKDAELERLTGLCVRGTLNDAEYLAAKSKVLGEKTALAQRLVARESDEEALSRETTDAIDLVEELRGALDAGTQNQRDLVALVADRVVALDRTVQFELKPVFKALLCANTAMEYANHLQPLKNTHETKGFMHFGAPVRRATKRLHQRVYANHPQTLVPQRKNAATRATFSLWWAALKEARKQYASTSRFQVEMNPTRVSFVNQTPDPRK